MFPTAGRADGGKAGAAGARGLMRGRRRAPVRRVVSGVQSAEACGGPDHGGGAPALHIAADPAEGAPAISKP